MLDPWWFEGTHVCLLAIFMGACGAMFSQLGLFIAETSERGTLTKQMLLGGGFFALGVAFCLAILTIDTLLP